MKRHEDNGSFWLSYSDLMTSMFFIMLVLFIVCIVKVSLSYKELEQEKQKTEQILAETQATNEQLQQILQLDKQFKELSNSSRLGYDEEKKMFYAKDFVGIEIFNPYDDHIKPEFDAKVKEVGADLQEILAKLHAENPRFSYQLVIEGTAAIKWEQKANGTYNPDNQEMYWLSYRRALALYNRWKAQGLDLRKYNTEIIIAGSGFNGINRDNKVEDNNKRFIIQIIPKVSRPAPTQEIESIDNILPKE